MAAECILQMFERVVSNLGKSMQLRRKLNRAGKPYGKSNYYLASFKKELGNDEDDDENDNPNHGNPDTAEHDAHAS